MPTVIDHVGVQRLMTEGALLIDALPQSEYQSIHLPGAINIPLDAFTPQRIADFDRSRPMITYCWNTQ